MKQLLKRKLTVFLLGSLIGVVLPLPTLLWYIKTPEIQAVIVSDAFYKQTQDEIEIVRIRDVQSFKGVKADLTIYIAPLEAVHQAKLLLEPDADVTGLLGFYDPAHHVIWTVRDHAVILHEIRHVFEGYYHR